MLQIIIVEPLKKASSVYNNRNNPFKINVLDATISAIDYYLSGPPGGHPPPPHKVRLSDDVGGVHGHGASMVNDNVEVKHVAQITLAIERKVFSFSPTNFSRRHISYWVCLCV